MKASNLIICFNIIIILYFIITRWLVNRGGMSLRVVHICPSLFFVLSVTRLMPLDWCSHLDTKFVVDKLRAISRLPLETVWIFCSLFSVEFVSYKPYFSPLFGASTKCSCLEAWSMFQQATLINKDYVIGRMIGTSLQDHIIFNNSFHQEPHGEIKWDWSYSLWLSDQGNIFLFALAKI